MQVNASPAGVSAVIPTLAVTPSGVVGVSYYDFRANDEASTLPTTLVVATCAAACDDPASWQESEVAGPFDSRANPATGLGLMLGDYAGLIAYDDELVAIYTEGTGDAANPTNIVSVSVPVPPAD